MSRFALSPEQVAVVAHPLEPLRVAAGAGTGKTTTVAHRIAHHIVDQGVEPDEVLGITFTNKAAEELADRVRQVLAGHVDDSRQIEVHTYHGFAAQLLREFGALVGVERDAPVVTPTFTRQMLSTVVRSIPLPHLNVTWSGAVDAVRRLAASLGDHLLDPSEVAAAGEARPGVETAEDDPWPARLDLLAAVEAYDREKRRLGVVDYGDLIQAAHRLVTEHPWVATRIRERYRAVVLDEYQDTNPAQRELLVTLFGDGFPVTAVGDVDQTIYEWRGASPGNFHRFPRHFPRRDGTPAATLPLTRNRRSATGVLDVANAIKCRIDDRSHDLLRPLEDAPPGLVTAGWFGDAVEEAEWIADEVTRIHASGARWSSVAILFRKNKDMAIVRDALAARDVPVEVANLGGLLSVPEVVEVHAWLRLLEDPGDGAALARLLTGSRHRLGLSDLAALARWVRTQHTVDESDDLPGFTLLEAIEVRRRVPGLRPEARQALDVFAGRHRALLESAQSVTLVELCRRILDVTGAWRDVEALSDSARLSARLNLYRFLDLAEEWSPLEGRPSLAAFLDYLATMEEEPAEELDSARLARADAVTLLTVHRAKGLEWETVFVPGAYESNFPSRVVGAYDDPYGRPESLPHELRLDREDRPALDVAMSPDQRRALLKQHHDAQEWRIAYVAATRARRSLLVTGAHWYGSPEPRARPAKPSPLFELVRDHPATEVVRDVATPPVRPETLGYRTERIPAPDPVFVREGWQSALRRAAVDPVHLDGEASELGLRSAYAAAVAEFQQMLFDLPAEPEPIPAAGMGTSVTGLVTYARCPRRFYWSEVDRLPRRYSPAARRGVDVHRRIELHHRGMVALEGTTREVDDSSDLGVRGRGDASNAYEVFSGSRFAEARPFLVEAPFELRLAGDVTVRGRIDAVYRSAADHWEVVDFKSGRPNGAPAARVQLQAYALAVNRGCCTGEIPEALTVTFAYLGGDLVEVSEAVDDAWIEEAADRLDALAAGIEAEEYTATPSAGCRGCDFLRFCGTGREHLAEATPS